MDSLLQVMAAKKRELAQIRGEKEGVKKPKYMRRADIENLLNAQEEKQQEERAVNRHELKVDSEDKSKAQVSNDKGSAEEEAMLPWAEIKRQLRELGEPITMFGETDQARITRLQEAEHRSATRREDELGDDHAARYEFARGSDEECGGGRAEDGFNDKLMPEGKVSRLKSGEQSATMTSVDEDDDDMMLVYRFFKDMLRRWEQDLANRPDHIKRTAQGKIATKTMKQCKDYIRPLFKLCKKREVSPDILPNLVQIVKFCQDGEFVQANDAYIKLAIGNAAWPIGVTMVGIHERTGREKINANKQAHVMNNEAQRKYITSVKRLISYAQSVANVLPSKKVN